jgi:hypothetical protein
MTCAVEVNEGIVTSAPPILKRFRGQPAKSLGNWMRAMGDVEFRRMADNDPKRMTHVYSWGNNEKRETLKGRPCRIVVNGKVMRSVLVEFDDGQREVVSIRALRKERT